MDELDENTKDFITFYSGFFTVIFLLLAVVYFYTKAKKEGGFKGIKGKDIIAVFKCFCMY